MWTPQNVIGLLCLVLAAVLPWLLADAEAGRGIGTALTLLGGGLTGWSAPAPAPRIQRGDERGHARTELTIVLAAVSAFALAGLLLLGGCGTARVDSERPLVVTVDSGPPCLVTAVDDAGELVARVSAPTACDPKVSRAWLCRRVTAQLGASEPTPAFCHGVAP